MFKSIHSALSWAWWEERGLKSGRDSTGRQLQAVNAAASAQTKPQSAKTCFFLFMGLNSSEQKCHKKRKSFLSLCWSGQHHHWVRSGFTVGNCVNLQLWNYLLSLRSHMPPHKFRILLHRVDRIEQLSRLAISCHPASPLVRPTAPLSLSQPDMKTLAAFNSHHRGRPAISRRGKTMRVEKWKTLQREAGMRFTMALNRS